MEGNDVDKSIETRRRTTNSGQLTKSARGVTRDTLLVTHSVQNVAIRNSLFTEEIEHGH